MTVTTPQSQSRAVALAYGILAAMYAAILYIFLSFISSLQELRQLWPIVGSTALQLVALLVIHGAMSGVTVSFYRRGAAHQLVVLGVALLLFIIATIGASQLVIELSRHTLRLPIDRTLGVVAKSLLALGYGILFWALLRIHRAANYAFERTVKSPRNHRRHRAAAQRER